MTSPTTRTGAASKRGMVSFIALLICCVFLPVGRVLLELHAVQSGVVSVEGHQLGMAAALDDTPLVHHHDDVRLSMVDRRWAITSAVRPCITLSSAAWIWRSDSVSRAEVASSRIRMGASRRSARAMASL